MGESRILGPEQIRDLESMEDGVTGRFGDMLEYIGRRISQGVAEGVFTEREAKHDLETALWVAYAANNLDDYEHYCTSAEWLSRVEDLARGCGTWYYRYANALMYTGRPRLAMEYLSRGVEEEPDYPWTWLTLGRLRSHFGDREGAMSAALRGLSLVPGDHEFEQLMDDIAAGRSLEEMEFHYIDPDTDTGLPTMAEAMSDEGELRDKWEAVMGICVDSEGLARMKAALEPSGWIADHPYCTYMKDTGSGTVVVNLMMNEAYLSKLPPESVRRVVDSLPELEAKAREHLEGSGRSVREEPVYGLAIDRRLRAMVSFGSFAKEDQVTVRFDSEGNIAVSSHSGGPFAAFVLLADDRWDPELFAEVLGKDWGIACRESADGDSLVFEVDGDLVALSLVRSPIPDGEAEANAANNYTWPGAVDAARSHRAHMLVAVVNHGLTPVDAGLLFTKVVCSCLKTTDPVGVYVTGTVLQPQTYIAVAESMREGELPILDMVWIGMYRTDAGINAYTNGMDAYAKDEVEVIGVDDDPGRVRAFVYDIVSYVLNNDAELRDGDTIGFSADQKLRIERSRGVSVEGMSLKVEYPRTED